MSRVLLCGAFGQANTGDDLLLASFARALEGHDLTVATPEAASSSSPHTVPATARGVLAAIREVDAVVVAGGTVFKLLHPSSGRHPLGLLATTASVQAAARLRGIPFALVGVGAGELRGRVARHLSRRIAEHADLLVLRDEESAAVLRDAGATEPFRVGADPAWSLLPPPPPSPGGRSGSGVLITLSHLADHDGSRLTDRLVQLVDHLTHQGIEVRLQPWQGGRHDADARLALVVRRRCREPRRIDVLERPADLVDAARACADAAAVVCLRFHSLLAAAAAERPFVAVAHEPKFAGLARRLQQISVPPHASPAVLREAGDLALRTPPAHRSLVDREVELARHSLRLLRVVLSRGAEDELIDDGRTELTTGVPW